MPKAAALSLSAFLTALLLMGCASQQAQQNLPTLASLPGDGETGREITRLLALGDTVFEQTTWLASGQETPENTIVVWDNSGVGGIGQAEYMHFEDGVDPSEQAELFSDERFAAAFSGYDTWTRTGSCTSGATRLDEFTLTLGGVNYLLRYWTEQVSPTRVLTFQILFPNDQAALLPQYAQRYNPSFNDCP